MATPPEFARNMKSRAAAYRESAKLVVRKAATAVLGTVVRATPVDTGRARGGWSIGISGPGPKIETRLDPSGAGAISSGSSKIAGSNTSLIYVSNAVTYISFLENGSSKQAPSGMMGQGVAAGIAAVRASKLTDNS